MICAAKLLAPMLLAWRLTGHADALALADAGRMFNVPPSVMWATAYSETRYSAFRNTQVSPAGAVGRMQILPRVWNWQCGRVYGQRYYNRNIHCGALVLRYYLARCDEDIRCAAFGYVGGDSAYSRTVGGNSLLYELKVKAASWPRDGVRF